VLPIKTGIATSGTIGSNAIDTTSILSGYGTSVIGRSARAASLGYEAGEFTPLLPPVR
jgi:hypothetical protein